MVTASKKRRGIEAIKKGENRFAWAVMAPMLVYFTVFTMLPVIFVIIIGFTDWNGFYLNDIRFIGFDNFTRIFTDTRYLKLFLNTLIFGVSILALTIIFGFLMAQLMVKDIFLKGFNRAAWYIPGIISFAVISDIVANMLTPDGILNQILLGMGLSRREWFGEAFWMYFFIILLSVWRGLGGTMLLFMAGLNSIPEDLYEYGKIEGANAFQRLWYITLPMIKPIFMFNLITSMIGMFNIFEPIQLISQGRPEGKTSVLMYEIYNKAFADFNMGMSCALSVLVMIIVLVLSAINLKYSDLQDLK
ncbi:MAG: sugar ABC transporter permease [Clostridia bacterium]|nr:sugar ABC transporter permease [Clostridia bacterium]